MTFSALKTPTRPRARAALALGAALALSTLSSQALACACGCGVFDIGGFNYGQGGNGPLGLSLWGSYSFMDQNQNWEGTSKAPASDNTDKQIKTSFYTVGGYYTIDRDWGVMANIPFFQRAFTTTYDYDANGNPLVGTFNMFSQGDLKALGVYSGFIPDHSLGAVFGLKLPTGQWQSPSYNVNGTVYSIYSGNAVYDRDSLPGTGSTDVILGGFKRGFLTADQRLTYFVQATYQFAFMTIEGYRPGNELDASAGLFYNLGAYGPFTQVSPGAQVLNSWRKNDSGAPADPLNSGYERVLFAPAIGASINNLSFYAEVAIPVYQYVNHAANVYIEGTDGQLVAPVLLKLVVGYDF